MPSQTDTALHIDGLTWALRRLGAVCVGETLCSGPQRQKPNVKGWFPLAGRVFGFPSKESGGGVGNPQSALGIVCATYVLPSTTLCFTQQDIECVHLLSCS